MGISPMLLRFLKESLSCTQSWKSRKLFSLFVLGFYRDASFQKISCIQEILLRMLLFQEILCCIKE